MKDFINKYHIKDKGEVFISSLIFLLMMFILIAPARFFQSMSLVHLSSQISVSYMSVIDLACLVESLLLITYFNLYKHNTFPKKNVAIFISIFFVIYAFCSAALFVTGNGPYVFEILSKMLTLLCSSLFAIYLISYKKYKQCGFFIVAFLTIICVAPIFLKNYKGYAEIHRAGSLGFFVNETGLFSCALLSIVLFGIKKHYVMRVILGAIAIYCSYICGSRRSILIAILLILIGLVYYYYRLTAHYRSKPKVFRFLIVLSILLIVGFIVGLSLSVNTIIQKVPALKRFFEEAFISGSFLGGDRLNLYTIVFEKAFENMWFGSFGSTSLASVTSLLSTSHTHNLLFQMILDYGVLLSIPFIFVFLFSLVLSVKAIAKKDEDTHIKICAHFYLFYFIYDMLGFGLWNPKMQVIVYICCAIMLIHYFKCDYKHEIRYNYVPLRRHYLCSI